MWRSQLNAAANMQFNSLYHASRFALAPCNNIDDLLESQPICVPDITCATYSARLYKPGVPITQFGGSSDSRVQWH